MHGNGVWKNLQSESHGVSNTKTQSLHQPVSKICSKIDMIRYLIQSV